MSEENAPKSGGVSGSELNRLRWMCSHRSMLEMDILLGDFLEKVFPDLDADHALAFLRLAEMEDPALWQMVNGTKSCADALQAEIIGLMKKARI